MSRSNRRSVAGKRALPELQRIVKEDDSGARELMKKEKHELDQLRQRITVELKQNMILDKDLKELDATIKLHVKQKMSVREILAKSQNIKSVDRKIKDGGSSLGATKKIYEDMFDLLQLEPHYCARIARLASASELHTFIQITIFTLYGDQYEARLERLLLIMFDLMLEAEFKACNDMGTFLRANTAITQLMSSYCRRGQGTALLKEVLRDPLTQLSNEAALDLEINPTKVYQTMIKQEELETGRPSALKRDVSYEEAAAHPVVQELIAVRVDNLERVVGEIFDSVVDNVDNIPFGIRWISRRMRDMCFAKWPHAKVEEVNSLVGGLCFLRYITPAITTPDALHIIESNVAYRRNFILVAKTIQNLSNNIRFGGKEAFMTPMNRFLERASGKLGAFFDELCNVESLDDHFRLEIMFSIDKRDQFITLSLNDIFHMHAMIDTHKNHLGLAPDDPLLRLSEQLGPAPPKLQRENDYPVNLTMSASGHQSSYAIKQEDESQKLSQLKERVVDLLRALPPIQQADHETFVDVLKRVRAEATRQDNMAQAKAITTIIVDLADLAAEGAYETPEHVFHSLAKDISSNVDLQAKISRNLKSARKLLEDIQAQRRDMQETLEIHLEYLKNVEDQSKLSSKEKSANKKVKLADKEFTHRELEEKRVIIDSRLPLEARKRVKFVISTDDCSTFRIQAKFKMVPTLSVEIQLKELLEKQEAGEFDLVVAGEVTLNVNLLMHLLNRHFIAEMEKVKMKHSGSIGRK